MRTRLNEWWRRKDMRYCLIAILLMTISFSACTDKAEQFCPKREELSVSKIDDSQLAEIQPRIAAAVSKARPAIVRIAWESTEPAGAGGQMNGVIVSPDGYVLTRGEYNLTAGKTVSVNLASGRQVRAKALGSYWSWDIRLVKITDKGPWQHVHFGSSANAKPGDVCISLGYPKPQSQSSDQAPSTRVVRILSIVPSRWLCTSCESFSGSEGDGLFDLDGQLIGIHSEIYVDKVFNPAIESVQRHWDDLTAGRQIDDLAPAGSGQVTAELATSDKRLAEATTKAKLATVRLVWGNKERDRVSGVIVTPDGYIATCQHHFRQRAEAVTVYLADGRTAAGKVLSSIPFCDIGLMKITEKGPWPYVEFGSSLAMKPGDVSILVGYPFAPIDDGMLEPQRTPAVRLGLVVKAKSWERGPGVLSTSCFNLSGDSGGGVFDIEGRLIAIHTGAEDYEGPTHNTRIEILQKQWDFLASGKSVDSLP